MFGEPRQVRKEATVSVTALCCFPSYFLLSSPKTFTNPLKFITF